MTANDVKNFEFASITKKAKTVGSFAINGENFDVRPLKDASMAYLVHRMRSGAPDVIISAVLDFTERALTAESAKRFEALVLDPDAGLEIAEIVQVFEHLLGMVSGLPTTSPKPSPAPRRRTGSASRAS